MSLPSYEDYAKAATEANKKALAESLQEADSDYARAKATYGTRASYLLGKGLSESGYSDYLQNAAYAARVNKQTAAKQAFTDAQAKTESAYAAFLQEARKQAENAYQKDQKTTASAFSKLLSQTIADKTVAKNYLVSMGVDEQTAEVLATQSIEMFHNTFERRKNVLSTVLSDRMTYDRAYRFALSNGLTEDMAREIAELAQSSFVS